jgi:hypothetical protein
MADWTAYLTAGKTALDILKGIRAELPKSEKSEEAGQKLEEAERSLKPSLQRGSVIEFVDALFHRKSCSGTKKRERASAPRAGTDIPQKVKSGKLLRVHGGGVSVQGFLAGVIGIACPWPNRQKIFQSYSVQGYRTIFVSATIQGWLRPSFDHEQGGLYGFGAEPVQGFLVRGGERSVQRYRRERPVLAPGQAREPGWPTVRLRYLRTYLGNPLTIEKMRKENPDISSLLLNGFQAASFPIPAEDFRAVLALLGETPGELPSPVKPLDIDTAKLAAIEAKYLDASPEVKERISKVIKRGAIGSLVKKATGFKCQLCEALGRNPICFVKENGEPYVEAHHVTPVSKQEIGTLAASNIMTLCPNNMGVPPALPGWQ